MARRRKISRSWVFRERRWDEVGVHNPLRARSLFRPPRRVRRRVVPNRINKTSRFLLHRERTVLRSFATAIWLRPWKALPSTRILMQMDHNARNLFGGLSLSTYLILPRRFFDDLDDLNLTALLRRKNSRLSFPFDALFSLSSFSLPFSFFSQKTLVVYHRRHHLFRSSWIVNYPAARFSVFTSQFFVLLGRSLLSSLIYLQRVFNVSLSVLLLIFLFSSSSLFLPFPMLSPPPA